MGRRRAESREAPPVRPVDVDGVRTVAFITVLWAGAFVILASQRSQLIEADRGWWVWTCLAGVGLGLLGLEYCRKRRDAMAHAELQEEAAAGVDDATSWDEVLGATDVPLHGSVPPTDRSATASSPGGRPPPGYVTGEMPAVRSQSQPSPSPALPPEPPRESPSELGRDEAAPRPGSEQPHPEVAAEPYLHPPVVSPAEQSPEPTARDAAWQHPTDVENDTETAAARQPPEIISEFFADLPARSPAPEDTQDDDDLLLDDLQSQHGRRRDSHDASGSGEYRERRARRE